MGRRDGSEGGEKEDGRGEGGRRNPNCIPIAFLLEEEEE